MALASIGEPAVPALIELIKDSDPELRKAVVGTLAEPRIWQQSWRPSALATKLAPDLEALARDADIQVRIALGNRLAATHCDSDASLALLRILLRDPNAEVRLAAVKAFGSTSTIPAGLRPEILERLKDRDRDVRVAAAVSIPTYDLASPAIINGLLGSLKDTEAHVRAAASQKLSEARYELLVSTVEGRCSQEIYTSAALARNPNAYAALKSAMADPNGRVRAAAASLLPVFPSETATSIPLLLDRLEDPVESVRGASVAALARFGPAVPQGAMRGLLALLTDPSELAVEGATISTHAARALAAIGGEAKAKMLRILINQLNSLDETVRQRARQILIVLREKVIHEMIQTLADRRSTRCVQIEVLWVLNAVMSGPSPGPPVVLWSAEKPPGPEVLAMVPVLRSLTREGNAEVRLAALGILVRIDPQSNEAPTQYFAYLREGQNEDLESQWLYGILRPGMIPELIEGLNDEDPKIRLGTANALGRMAHWLAEVERSDQTDAAKPAAVRSEASARRQRLKVQAAHALLSALKDPDARVRWIAAETLGVLEVEAETAIPLLIAMAKSDKKLVLVEDPVAIRSFEEEGQEYLLGPGKPGGDPVRIAAAPGSGFLRRRSGPGGPGPRSIPPRSGSPRPLVRGRGPRAHRTGREGGRPGTHRGAAVARHRTRRRARRGHGRRTDPSDSGRGPEKGRSRGPRRHSGPDPGSDWSRFPRSHRSDAGPRRDRSRCGRRRPGADPPHDSRPGHRHDGDLSDRPRADWLACDSGPD